MKCVACNLVATFFILHWNSSNPIKLLILRWDGLCMRSVNRVHDSWHFYRMSFMLFVRFSLAQSQYFRSLNPGCIAVAIEFPVEALRSVRDWIKIKNRGALEHLAYWTHHSDDWVTCQLSAVIRDWIVIRFQSIRLLRSRAGLHSTFFICRTAL